MDLIVDRHAGSQAATAKTGHPLNSELAILTGLSFLNTHRLGQCLCYSLRSAQMARSPMTHLDQILTYRFQSKLRIKGNYSIYLAGGSTCVLGYALDCCRRNVAISILNLLKDWYHGSRLHIVLVNYGVNYGETELFSGT